MVPSRAQRRGKAMVDSEVQGGVLKIIAMHWVLLLIANTLALMIWIRLFERPDMRWAETFQICLERYVPFFVVSIVLVPAFVWDTLKLTNRFAGPILRLRSALTEAAQGRAVAPLHFRRNDFWQGIANDFNQVIQQNQNAAVGTETPQSNG